MELPTPSVDRVLEALSPALTVELDRIVSELRQTLEADFEIKLQTTIEDVRERAMEKGSYELQLAVDEARDSVRAAVTQEQQQQFAEARGVMERVQRETVAQLEAERTAWTAERARLQQQLEQWKTFAEAQRQLADAGSQAEILIRWLKLAEPFASGVAIYTTKADGLSLWKSRGAAVFPEIISRETIDPEFYFRPVAIRGKTVAAVCATQASRVDALDFLVEVMELAIEVFGLRLRTPPSRNSEVEAARIR